MENKIKVIQICAVDTTVDKLLRALNDILNDNGYDVINICSFGNNTENLKSEGFKIINTNIDRKIRPISNLKTIINLYKIFKIEKPQIVHVHTPIASVLGRVAAKLARVPVIIYTAHGFYFHENMKPQVYKFYFNIEKFMARYFTDYIFTQSLEDSNTAKAGKFLKEKRILAIGNGVDVFGKFNKNNIDSNEISILKSNLGIDENDKVVSFIGRMVREKGILDLLDGFNKVNSKNVKLLVIGDIFQGDRDLNCKEKIEMYKNNKNIIFTGKRDDINNLLYITDIFCLPSYREGMPRSIIEAMASECAIIATDIRGSREEVVEGKTGFLVPLQSPNIIKEKIELLINDSETLNKMKINGRKRAEELYDEKAIVYKQLEVFKELLSEKGGNNYEVRRFN